MTTLLLAIFWSWISSIYGKPFFFLSDTQSKAGTGEGCSWKSRGWKKKIRGRDSYVESFTGKTSKRYNLEVHFKKHFCVGNLVLVAFPIILVAFKWFSLCMHDQNVFLFSTTNIESKLTTKITISQSKFQFQLGVFTWHH